jgi:nuclear transport factor 2 (NTF2) superfamily protein
MFVLLILISFFSRSDKDKVQNRDHCSLFGSVYVEKDRNRADYLVYVEESEAFAQLIVFKEQNRLFADKRGLWHFTGNRGLAKFTIYFVKDRHSAHFSIYYTDAATFAGCN